MVYGRCVAILSLCLCSLSSNNKQRGTPRQNRFSLLLPSALSQQRRKHFSKVPGGSISLLCVRSVHALGRSLPFCIKIPTSLRCLAASLLPRGWAACGMPGSFAFAVFFDCTVHERLGPCWNLKNVGVDIGIDILM